jgi:hypothetical protein
VRRAGHLGGQCKRYVRKTATLPVLPAAAVAGERRRRVGLAGLAGGPHSGERRGFASLAELIAFLEEETTGSPRDEAPPDTEERKPGE